ncbi:MAG: hypothetical protein R3268_07845 [Acidiferrobacterales bacterium]|nr:hypothetical protein [Acidiferrobacterales bacterium]
MSLAALVINDGYLKYVFPGLVTGKLSDVAGIFLVSLLVFSLFPTRKLQSSLLVGAVFLLWKSGLSQPAIDWFNSISSVRLGRVVDYSDLLALLVVPLAWRYSDGTDRKQLSRPSTRVASLPIAVISLLAITGTSIMFPTRDFTMRDAATDSQVQNRDVYEAVQRVGQKYELVCKDCDPAATDNRFVGDDLFIEYWIPEDDGDIRFMVQLIKVPRFFWSDFDYELLDGAIADLKIEFGKLSPQMEYVEQLYHPSRRESGNAVPKASVASLPAYVAALSNEYPDGGELYCETPAGGERRPFNSCETFSALRDDGCFGYSTYDMSLESRYAAMCELSAALMTAEEPKSNYFSLDSSDWWRSLPAEVIPMSGGVYSEESWNIAAARRQDLVDGKVLGDLPLSEIDAGPGRMAATVDSTTLDCGEVRNRFEVEATLYADFDGDGVAELLLEGYRVDRSESCALGTGNSLGAAFSIVVKKDSPEAPIVVLKVPGIG